jgi:hypothetical protein
MLASSKQRACPEIAQVSPPAQRGFTRAQNLQSQHHLEHYSSVSQHIRPVLLTGIAPRERSGETFCRAYAPARIAVSGRRRTSRSCVSLATRICSATLSLIAMLHRIIINHHPCRIPLLSIYFRCGEETGRRALLSHAV